MALTFGALVKLADFQSPAPTSSTTAKTEQPEAEENATKPGAGHGLKLGGLVYNIQIVLPESRDSAVYDALFQSLRRHLV